MSSRLILALDFHCKEQALALIETLDPNLCKLKVGSEMYTRFGPNWIRYLVMLGFDVFLDLKFHDIPRTVGRAVSGAADLGVWMINVHTSGGIRMLEAARQALIPFGPQRPLLIGVTVMTCYTETEFKLMGFNQSIEAHSLFLARQAKNCGLDGVVASAHEACAIKQCLGKEFVLVTPGIRLHAQMIDNTDDQRRIMTPAQAIQAGSDYLVMGRSLLGANDSVAALICTLNEQLASLVLKTA